MSAGRLRYATLRPITLPLAVVPPNGLLDCTRIPPPNGVASPGRLAHTVLWVTTLFRAPSRKMPVPEGGGNPSSLTAGQGLSLGVTSLDPTTHRGGRGGGGGS